MNALNGDAHAHRWRVGKKLSDFKLLFPTDWTDFQASHGAFVKEWNALMGL